jgi:hypothetical protein
MDAKYFFELQASIDNLSNAIAKLNADNDIHSLLIFMADNSILNECDINQALRTSSKPILGGIFPGIIYNGEHHESGILIVGLSYGMKTTSISLSDCEVLNQKIEDFYKNVDVSNHSLLLFVDAFADYKIKFIESLYNHFGISVRYLGGGAGSLSFKRKPTVFTEKGILENAAVIGLVKNKIEIGVAHGWTPISNPLKVTEAEGNKIKSINWEPAFEVYKKIIKEHSGLNLEKENFFSIAKSYPFGMTKIQSNFVVRDPISSHENELIIVDEIPQGEFVYVLHGNKEQLLKGAREARDSGVSNNDNSIFCIDCISRVLYMKDNFGEEIKTIDENKNVCGVLTIGEIANSDNSLEIYNKTVVVTQL